MNKVVLIGGGGHSKVIQDIIMLHPDMKLYAIVDDAYKHEYEINGVIYAPINFVNMLDVNDFSFCIAIGNNIIREQIYKRLPIKDDQYITLIHPSAVVSHKSKIGSGTVIMPNVIINADSTIGKHCIINSGAIVEHDNIIEDYAHISPHATLSGSVRVGKGTHIGAGATVIPETTLGQWSVVGAGAVVVKDVSDAITVVGVPAKKIN
ncbi:acetyltransferase [Lentibacillus saliphilus]|uniref:acetyltransferase n=1 Tax=Lentibacillus saliphilus TaxID=2737028 RepID=UPI001C2F2CF1|nr:acetyltransferase [Lentibacillus saliphilus]